MKKSFLPPFIQVLCLLLLLAMGCNKVQAQQQADIYEITHLGTAALDAKYKFLLSNGIRRFKFGLNMLLGYDQDNEALFFSNSNPITAGNTYYNVKEFFNFGGVEGELTVLNVRIYIVEAIRKPASLLFPNQQGVFRLLPQVYASSAVTFFMRTIIYEYAPVSFSIHQIDRKSVV